jgi:hypothetical protein
MLKIDSVSKWSPDAPLWLHSEDVPFTYDAARTMLRRRAEEARVKKRFKVESSR